MQKRLDFNYVLLICLKTLEGYKMAKGREIVNQARRNHQIKKDIRKEETQTRIDQSSFSVRRGAQKAVAVVKNAGVFAPVVLPVKGMMRVASGTKHFITEPGRLARIKGGLVNTGRAMGGAGRRVYDSFLLDYHTYPNGVDPAQTLLQINIDDVSTAEIERLRRSLQQGTKVLFVTNGDRKSAVKAVQDMGLFDDLYEKDSDKNKEKYGKNILFMCDKEHSIYTSSTYNLASTIISVKSPKRDEDGAVILDEKTGMPELESPSKKSWFTYGQEDLIIQYATNNPDLGITLDRDTKRITIGGSNREEQLYNAKVLVEYLNSLVFHPTKDVAPTVDPELKSNLGIVFTEKGLQIREMSDSFVNAEYTAYKEAGIAPENVRRVVSNIGEVSNTYKLDDFEQMFEGKSSVKAKDEHILGDILANMEFVTTEVPFLTQDRNTHHGSYLPRYNLRTCHNLNELHKLNRNLVEIGRYGARGHDGGSVGHGRVEHYNEVFDAIYSTTTLMYDRNEIEFPGKITAAQRDVAKQNIADRVNIEANKKVVKQFEEYAMWQRETINNVLNYVIGVPPEHSLPKLGKVKGRVSSFIAAAVGKGRMPATSAQDYINYRVFQQDTSQNLIAYTKLIQKIDDPQKRAYEAQVFTGFMCGLEYHIKEKKASREEIMNEINEFVATHMDIDEATATATPPSPSGGSPSSDGGSGKTPPAPSPTPPSPTPPTPTPGPKPDGGESGKHDSEDDDVSEKGREMTSYLRYRAIKENITAGQDMLDSIIQQHGGDIESAKVDPAYVYCSEVVSKYQDLSKEYDKNIPNIPAGLDEKRVNQEIVYSTRNRIITNVNILNIAEAKIKGAEYTPIPLFKIPNSIKNGVVHQQFVVAYQQAVENAVDNIDLSIVKDSNDHNFLMDLNDGASQALGSTLPTPAPQLSKDYEFAVELATQDAQLVLQLSSLVLAKQPLEEVTKDDTSTLFGDDTLKEENTEDTISPTDVATNIQPFIYIPPINLNQSKQYFSNNILDMGTLPTVKMNNKELYNLNKYHGEVASRIEGYLVDHGYEGTATLQILEELNEALPTKKRLTQNNTSDFKSLTSKSVEWGFVQSHFKQIEEKYIDNPTAYKRALDLFGLEFALTQRLGLYRPNITNDKDRGVYRFLDMTTTTEEAITSTLLENIVTSKDMEKTLSLIRLASRNTAEYHFYQMQTFGNFELAEQQFSRVALQPKLDRYTHIRPFSVIALNNTQEYLQKTGLAKTDKLTCELYGELSKAYQDSMNAFGRNLTEVNVKDEVNAGQRDNDLKTFNKVYIDLKAKYGHKPEFYKALYYVTASLGQAETLTEKFRQANSRTPWESLYRAGEKGKQEFVEQHKIDLDADLDIVVQESNTAVLFAQSAEEAKNIKREKAEEMTARVQQANNPTSNVTESEEKEVEQEANLTEGRTFNLDEKPTLTPEKEQQMIERAFINIVAHAKLEEMQEAIENKYGGDETKYKEDPLYQTVIKEKTTKKTEGTKLLSQVDAEKVMAYRQTDKGNTIAKTMNYLSSNAYDAMANDSEIMNPIDLTQDYNKDVKYIVDRINSGAKLTAEEQAIVQNSPLVIDYLKQQAEKLKAREEKFTKEDTQAPLHEDTQKNVKDVYILLQSVDNAEKMKNSILARYNGNKDQASRDRVYAKLTEYSNSQVQKLQKEYKNVKADDVKNYSMTPEGKTTAKAMTYFSNHTYNVIEQKDKHAPKMTEIDLNDEENADVKQIIENMQAKGWTNLTQEEQDLLQNSPLVWDMAVEYGKKIIKTEQDKKQEEENRQRAETIAGTKKVTTVTTTKIGNAGTKTLADGVSNDNTDYVIDQKGLSH